MRKLIVFTLTLIVIATAAPYLRTADADVPPRTQARVCRSTLTVFDAVNLDFQTGQIATLEFGDVVDVVTDRIVFARGAFGSYTFSEIITPDGVQGFVLRTYLNATGQEGWVQTEALRIPPFAVRTIGGPVNIRSGPGTDNAILDTVDVLTCFIVRDVVEVPDGGTWYRVTTTQGEPIGWVIQVWTRLTTSREFPGPAQQNCP
jgi:hypothetical protein